MAFPVGSGNGVWGMVCKVFYGELTVAKEEEEIEVLDD
jgi:hypothetical protein